MGGRVKLKTVTEIRRSSAHDTFIANSVYLVLIFFVSVCSEILCVPNSSELCEALKMYVNSVRHLKPIGSLGREWDSLCSPQFTLFKMYLNYVRHLKPIGSL